MSKWQASRLEQLLCYKTFEVALRELALSTIGNAAAQQALINIARISGTDLRVALGMEAKSQCTLDKIQDALDRKDLMPDAIWTVGEYEIHINPEKFLEAAGGSTKPDLIEHFLEQLRVEAERRGMRVIVEPRRE